MKYRTAGTSMGHKLIIRERQTAFDASKAQKSSSFGALEDHKEMKTWEYAAFQKKQFNKKRRETKKRRIIFVVSAILAIVTLILLMLIFTNILEPQFLQKSY